MNEYLIKKVIARDGEREIVPSSQEEMQTFIVEGIRPDFEDASVLCVKFLYCLCEDDDEPEDTCWYINPSLCRKQYACETLSAYGPRMDSAFIPELLLVSPHNGYNVFSKFEKFNTQLLILGTTYLPDAEKLELFLKKIDSID